jgi:hypothetical protein
LESRDLSKQKGIFWKKSPNFPPKKLFEKSPICKALSGFFLCILSCHTCLKKPVFSKWDLLQWKVSARAVLGPSDQPNVPASMSLFLKSEKSQLCFTKENTYLPGPNSRNPKP